VVERILTCNFFPDSPTDLSWIFDNAGEESKLGQLFLNKVTKKIGHETLDELPKEMLVALCGVWKQNNEVLDMETRKLRERERGSYTCGNDFFGGDLFDDSYERGKLASEVEKYSVPVAEREER